MKKYNDIGILGGGWLGTAIANRALASGEAIRISTTSSEKLKKLLKQGMEAYLLKVTESKIKGNLDFFEGLDVLIIALPPGLRKNPNRNYVSMIQQIINITLRSNIKKVLYTSSTSVYGHHEKAITEESELLGNTPSALQIMAAEKLLQDYNDFESCIVRLGGLIGPNRHPIRSLAGKTLSDPATPINFIHQKDAVEIILRLLEKWSDPQVFNAVTPHHPNRKTYYTHMAKLAKLPPPIFSKNGKVRGVVSTQKLIDYLDYSFLVKNLLILN